MRYRLLIAWRYFFARRHRSVVNIISRISLGGIVVCSFSLIVVLSVYNGIGQLTQQLFSVFDPELCLDATDSKVFCCDAATLDRLGRVDGVAHVTPLVEEKAWAIYREQQSIVQLRGVEGDYGRLTGLDTLMAEGVWDIAPTAPGEPVGVALGSEIYYRLGISSYSNQPLQLMIPKRGGGIGTTVAEAFNSCQTIPTGYFWVQQDIDSRYAVTDISTVRHLLGYSDTECSALAFVLRHGADSRRVRDEVLAIMSDAVPQCQFRCRDRMEQQPLYFKVFRTERLAIYLILSLITLVASLTLVASTRLLVIEKRSVSVTLRAMGLTESDVRAVYRWQGVIISATGCLVGLLLGGLVCMLQQHYGWVKMGDNFVTEAFPVAMRAIDFVWVFLIVMAIGTLAVTATVRRTAVFPTRF